MAMEIFILSCLYFFLPAYITNMTASLSRRMLFLKPIEKPVDFGRKLNGLPLLGSHKTWRGVVCGTIAGMLTVWLQSLLFKTSFFKEISLLNYQEINIFLFGFLISFGAIFGDLLFAFFKRRQKIISGALWIPFDQVNYVIGAFLFLTPFFKIELNFWIGLIVLTFFLHIFVNHLGYWLGLQKNKW